MPRGRMVSCWAETCGQMRIYCLGCLSTLALPTCRREDEAEKKSQISVGVPNGAILACGIYVAAKIICDRGSHAPKSGFHGVHFMSSDTGQSRVVLYCAIWVKWKPRRGPGRPCSDV